MSATPRPASRPASRANTGDPGWELATMERRYSVPPNAAPHNDPRLMQHNGGTPNPGGPSASEDLHAWSIYRQNLNSDFTDSALGSSEKSPLPYGNFQLRESTVQSILSHPRYGPKSALGSNMYTYLKFGLPRVFPPSRGPRDGSSGYDSSEDGSPYLHRQGRHYLRSRSDPDFRNQQLNKPYTGHGPRPANGEAWVRTKSHSEANLLSEPYVRAPQGEHRRSMHDIRHMQQAESRPDPRMRRPIKSSSVHSSRRVSARPLDAPRLNAVPESAGAHYAALPDHVESHGAFRYPHLQARGLDAVIGNTIVLAGVNFEVYGGEILAVMCTAEEEGTALLDCLSGRQDGRMRRLAGDLLLNGQSVRPRQLRDRVAYVQSDTHLSPDLTVKQTLRLHRWLRYSPVDTSKVTTADRIAALVEDLGLAQVAHTKVSGLTTSERRRLNVACHLLLDTDIVVLDQPTRGMDIFDTFFLVEFLRQWAGDAQTGALTGGHIVVLTLHPPTYEIFTMLSRVVLLSAGRAMFAGRRRDMLPYFASVEYPCPAFKNPSDYYLDLVTLDDLSAEAMLESSQRIEQLADIFRRRQEPLSDPGPPVALPTKLRHANPISQSLAIFTRALVYSQPLTLVRWFSLLLLAAVTSLAVGAVFFDVPASDPTLVLSDRVGYHYAMAAVAPWPIALALALAEVSRERYPVSRDVADQLYGRLVYILTKTLYSLPASVCVWIAYVLPGYLMTGLHMQGANDALYIYTGYMVLYLLAMQSALTALAYASSSRALSSCLAGLLFTALTLASGVALHPGDLGEWAAWLAWPAPLKWLTPQLLEREHSAEALRSTAVTCRNKQVQRQDIIVQVPCPSPDGASALAYLGVAPPTPSSTPEEASVVAACALAAFLVAWLVLGVLAFMTRRFRPKQPRNNPNKP